MILSFIRFLETLCGDRNNPKANPTNNRDDEEGTHSKSQQISLLELSNDTDTIASQGETKPEHPIQHELVSKTWSYFLLNKQRHSYASDESVNTLPITNEETRSEIDVCFLEAR